MNIKQWIVRVFGVVGQFISTLFKEAVRQELEVVLPLAARAVAQVAADPSLVQPNHKREAAIATILAELSAAQIQIGLSVVSLAIELAVQAQKSK